MTQLYVVEVRKNTVGEFEHNVFWLWDEDEVKARLKGESKYHEVLAAAAVSTFVEHSAILFTSQGYPIMHQCYTHVPEPEPEPEVTE